MSAPPPLGQDPKPPAKGKLSVLLEAVGDIDVGEYVIALGLGVKAFQEARRQAKREKEEKHDQSNGSDSGAGH